MSWLPEYIAIRGIEIDVMPIGGNWVIGGNRTQSAAARLFCFPYAGGGASVFFSWSEKLQTDVDVCRVQLPGRENRFGDAAFRSMEPLVDALARVLRPYLDRPFAFYGHSMGALIGFELAHRMRQEYGLGPACLFSASYGAPQLPCEEPNIHHLPDDELANAIRQRYNSIPEEVKDHPELLEMMIKVLRADMELYETYEYVEREPLNCPVWALGGEQDRELCEADLLAWGQLTRGPFDVQMFPGDHFFLKSQQGPLLAFLAHKLNLLTNPAAARLSRE